jgi:hypothetical protein
MRRLILITVTCLWMASAARAEQVCAGPDAATLVSELTCSPVIAGGNTAYGRQKLAFNATVCDSVALPPTCTDAQVKLLNPALKVYATTAVGTREFALEQLVAAITRNTIESHGNIDANQLAAGFRATRGDTASDAFCAAASLAVGCTREAAGRVLYGVD